MHTHNNALLYIERGCDKFLVSRKSDLKFKRKIFEKVFSPMRLKVKT